MSIIASGHGSIVGFGEGSALGTGLGFGCGHDPCPFIPPGEMWNWQDVCFPDPFENQDMCIGQAPTERELPPVGWQAQSPCPPGAFAGVTHGWLLCANRRGRFTATATAAPSIRTPEPPAIRRGGVAISLSWDAARFDIDEALSGEPPRNLSVELDNWSPQDPIRNVFLVLGARSEVDRTGGFPGEPFCAASTGAITGLSFEPE